MRKHKRRSLKQPLYKMKGCSKTHKHYLGGNAVAEKPLFSFSEPIESIGGSACGLSNPASIPVNTNAANPLYPNTGAVSLGANTIFNNASPQLGGSCPLCAPGFMVGGTDAAHRVGCRCSQCKQQMTGGGGNAYPNGLVGTAWSSSAWPGANNVPGDNNHYPLNTYHTDISRQMVDVGPNRPFNGGMHGGKSKRRKHRGKQHGGSVSNFMSQDLINLGRQFQFGVGSAYNALAGYNAPVNPLPWKDQMHVKTAFNPAKI